MKHLKNIILFLFGATILFSSCYPDNDIYPEETDTVYTTYLPGTDFHTMKYYLLVDSILRLDSLSVFGNEQYDQLIISKLEMNLNKRGFVNAKGQDTTMVDFIVVVSDISRFDITYYWAYLPYGYLYPNYMDEDLNAFYPLPPPTNIMLSARNGLLVDILEYQINTKKDTTNLYWRGLSNGVQRQYMESRLVSNIDRMFYQSPNLQSLK